MEKVYQLEVIGDYTQAKFDEWSHSLLFADSILPTEGRTTAAGAAGKSVIVTSSVDSSGTSTGADYVLLADDSRSEAAITVSTGKFVEGNLIAVLCPSARDQCP